jgi:hypothetical protein
METVVGEKVTVGDQCLSEEFLGLAIHLQKFTLGVNLGCLGKMGS